MEYPFGGTTFLKFFWHKIAKLPLRVSAVSRSDIPTRASPLRAVVPVWEPVLRTDDPGKRRWPRSGRSNISPGALREPTWQEIPSGIETASININSLFSVPVQENGNFTSLLNFIIGHAKVRFVNFLFFLGGGFVDTGWFRRGKVNSVSSGEAGYSR